ncbi:MAG: hypothetical protein K9G58_02320 [Bacteroidales bacterium]|nr:hypothetical protein [Bacteroidales bacterium]MCF8387916.1 hypothetical protein [Bacteroidales bacterium]MCF8396972.1 hypothetical protein [Bacteroidales bacterium]
MNRKIRSVLLWILSFLLMAVFAIYQRMTGPTYPVNSSATIEGVALDYHFPRSQDSDEDAMVEVETKDPDIKGTFHFRRYKSHDKWTTIPMERVDGKLRASIPRQPAAGKVMYKVDIEKNGTVKRITEEPVIIRFKGSVPDQVLYPHIFFIFLAMVFSIRTGIEALLKGKYTYLYTIITTLLLLLGGMILGPIVQKYAFDAYWTGWPFGHDLTDNKTLVSFILWIIAFFVLRKNKENRSWPIIASLALIAVYLIPHSVLGSELDYTAIENNQP